MFIYGALKNTLFDLAVIKIVLNGQMFKPPNSYGNHNFIVDYEILASNSERYDLNIHSRAQTLYNQTDYFLPAYK